MVRRKQKLAFLNKRGVFFSIAAIVVMSLFYLHFQGSIDATKAQQEKELEQNDFVIGARLLADFDGNYLENTLAYSTKITIRNLSLAPGSDFKSRFNSAILESVSYTVEKMEEDFKGFDLDVNIVSLNFSFNQSSVWDIDVDYDIVYSLSLNGGKQFWLKRINRTISTNIYGYYYRGGVVNTLDSWVADSSNPSFANLLLGDLTPSPFGLTCGICGNGVEECIEQCEDGGVCSNNNGVLCNFLSDSITSNDGLDLCGLGATCIPKGGDGCDMFCIVEECGNGFVQASNGEQCDDGNNFGDDGCDAFCQLEFCGDGIAQVGLGEQCDNGGRCSDNFAPCFTGANSGLDSCANPSTASCIPQPGDTCDETCVNEMCGNGIFQPLNPTPPGEQCDDGNNNPLDACDACAKTVCGDGVKQTPNGDGIVETCDAGAGNSDIDPFACRTNCRLPGCGDGLPNPGENCDDGNNVDGDGCNTFLLDGTASCMFVCGDGTTSLGEECDFGLANSDLTPDSCRTNCKLPVCGDGVTDPINNEQCDDSNLLANDGCEECKRTGICGDGIIEFDEGCDDGNRDDGDGCDSICLVEPICGNFLTERYEGCDDGNLLSGDGCDSDCAIEPLVDLLCANRLACNSDESCVYTKFQADDSHVALCSNPYSNAVCCKTSDVSCSIGVNVRSSCLVSETGLISLLKPEDSHVEDPNLVNYANDICLSVSGGVCSNGELVCKIFDNDGLGGCPGGFTCLGSVFSSTNSHVADCDTYDNNICCVVLPGICGDGIQDIGEMCDDGGLIGGDGCSPLCQIEPYALTFYTVEGICAPDDVCVYEQFKANNSHGALCSSPAGSDYDFNVCANLSILSCDLDCSPKLSCAQNEEGIISLSDSTDAHAEAPLLLGYANDVCCSLGGSCSGAPLDCRVYNHQGFGGCPTGFSCASSVSASFDAHLGVCDYYDYNVCCEVASNSNYFVGCGNSFIDVGEECDAGISNSDVLPDACRMDCTLPFCGDEIVDSSEQCDAGLVNSDTIPDACRTTCVDPACGDGVIDSGEVCDDALANSDSIPDACRATCVDPACGDGVVDSGEQCDSGLANSNSDADACRLSCQNSFCGDGVVDSGEACDDSNSVSNDGCSSACVVEFCGDGIVQTSEGCDDGGTSGGNGCSATCSVELGWACAGQPSACCQVIDCQVGSWSPPQSNYYCDQTFIQTRPITTPPSCGGTACQATSRLVSGTQNRQIGSWSNPGCCTQRCDGAACSGTQTRPLACGGSTSRSCSLGPKTCGGGQFCYASTQCINNCGAVGDFKFNDYTSNRFAIEGWRMTSCKGGYANGYTSIGPGAGIGGYGRERLVVLSSGPLCGSAWITSSYWQWLGNYRIDYPCSGGRSITGGTFQCCK